MNNNTNNTVRTYSEAARTLAGLRKGGPSSTLDKGLNDIAEGIIALVNENLALRAALGVPCTQAVTPQNLQPQPSIPAPALSPAPQAATHVETMFERAGRIARTFRLNAEGIRRAESETAKSSHLLAKALHGPAASVDTGAPTGFSQRNGGAG